MMDELLTDFTGLEKHVKDCGLPYLEAVIDYYRVLGEQQGFTVAKDASVIKNAHNFGKIELIWVEPNTAFIKEFGTLADIYQHLWKIMILQPAHTVILLSGNSNCKPEKIKQIVEKTPQLKKTKFTILDITKHKKL